MPAASSCRCPRSRCEPGNPRCSPAGSTHPSGPRRSRALFLQGRPQPLLKVEFRIEDLPHEQDDLALRIEAVSAAIVPEPREDLAIDANVELDLLQTPRYRGPRISPRHVSRMECGLLQDSYKSIQIVSFGSIRSN